MEHVTLKAGGTVDLRAVADIPERLRRPIRRIQMKLAADPAFAGVVKDAQKSGISEAKDIVEGQAMEMVAAMGDEAFELMDDLNDRAVMARVMGWSFGSEVTLEALQDLPGSVYDELRELCAAGLLDAGVDFSPSQDENSPTDPSTASA